MIVYDVIIDERGLNKNILFGGLVESFIWC